MGYWRPSSRCTSRSARRRTLVSIAHKTYQSKSHTPLRWRPRTEFPLPGRPPLRVRGRVELVVAAMAWRWGRRHVRPPRRHRRAGGAGLLPSFPRHRRDTDGGTGSGPAPTPRPQTCPGVRGPVCPGPREVPRRARLVCSKSLSRCPQRYKCQPAAAGAEPWLIKAPRRSRAGAALAHRRAALSRRS